MCDIATSAIAETTDGVCVGETAKHRTPNRAMRRRLMRRAHGRCEAPGCDAAHRLHAHHIVHWANGGPTEDHNLVMVCEFHHHLVHEGGWGIVGDPGKGIELVRPAENAPRGEQPISTPNRITNTHQRSGFRPKHDREPDDRPDYGYINDVIAHNRRLLNPTTRPSAVDRGVGEEARPSEPELVAVSDHVQFLAGERALEGDTEQ